MSISCDTFNGKSFDNSNSISTGFFFVASNNKTITFFDKWYGARNNSGLATEQDELNYLKTEGVFDKLNMKVRYLETDKFCGLCQRKCNLKKVMTVNANCCGTEKAKISDLSAVLKAKLRSDGQATVKWPKPKACLDSLKVNTSQKIFPIFGTDSVILDQYILLHFLKLSTNSILHQFTLKITIVSLKLYSKHQIHHK